MLKFCTLTIILGLFVANVMAGDGEFAAHNIPSELREHANIVKRKEEIRFELEGPGFAKEYHRVALTVLNENGNRYAVFFEWYDKLNTLESIDGTLYDESGKKIKSLKKSEIEDHSGTSSNNLADDSRIKYHNFYCKSYPYTVEYEWVTKSRNTMFFPTWTPMERNINYAVQESRISIICPEDYKIRYKAFNYITEPQLGTQKSNKIYTWEVTNLKAVVSEFGLPQWRDITPEIYFGPSEFEVEGYRGNMQSWADYGKFIYALKKDKDQLPPDVKEKVHQIADRQTDPKEKVSRLYEFLQQNTRYISVQLGIGGWQPYDASYVATKKYGDCKALSNFMYSLLKEAGIKSYYTLIRAGEHETYFMEDFPSSQFNHVITCVPVGKDTMWLECTSQSLPAGYLSGFTADRDALLIDESGGKLVHTPKYNYIVNLRARTIEARLRENGDLEANVHTRYSAMQEDLVEMLINNYSKDKVTEYLKTVIDLPTYDILQSDYKQEKAALPAIDEWLKLTATNYAQVTGKRLFINPNIISRSRTRLEREDDRKFEIQLYEEFSHLDTVKIQMPRDYDLESVPEEKTLESPFGTYHREVNIKGKDIFYVRKVTRYSGKFPAKSYSNLLNFFEQVYKADQAQVVFVKSN